jgi:hypothetical protein
VTVAIERKTASRIQMCRDPPKTRYFILGAIESEAKVGTKPDAGGIYPPPLTTASQRQCDSVAHGPVPPCNASPQDRM